MNKSTKELIIRHLKGIISALEKDDSYPEKDDPKKKNRVYIIDVEDHEYKDGTWKSFFTLSNGEVVETLYKGNDAVERISKEREDLLKFGVSEKAFDDFLKRLEGGIAYVRIK